ncbi:MAG: adenylosuccinate synthetase, partial [Akkermansiaceae bacterium]
KRGIGPTYADKAARWGIRLGDLLRPAYLRKRLEQLLPRKNKLLSFYDQLPIELEPLLEQCLAWGQHYKHMIVDTLPMIQTAVRGGQKVLLEGQLGVMRDLDWGIYPYATSSNPTELLL